MTVEHLRDVAVSRVPGTRRGGLKFLALLCVWVGCNSGGELDAVGGRASEGDAVAVGRAQGLRVEQPLEVPPGGSAFRTERPRPPERAPAVQAWREAPGEASALGLARAYFPRLSGDTEAEQPRLPVNPAMALRVSPAATEDGEVELSTRGYVFHVRSQQGGTASVSRREAGALFYGARHFWAAAGGPLAEEGGLWVTPRVDELAVVEGGGAPYRASYEVRVPEGIEAVRDAGEYLEFLDGQQVPVVRLHYPVARDGAGRGRQGEVRLRGATLTESSGPGEMPRFALEGQTLQVEMEVALEGLEGTALVSPGWSSAGVMATPRVYLRSALLPDGKVIVMGGQDYYNTLASAEVYDPATGTWSATGSMSFTRSMHTAVVLPDGKVMVAGGTSETSGAELYDPATGTWSTIGGVSGLTSGFTATLLLNGKVLLAGMDGNTGAHLYDPVTGAWTPTGPMAYQRYLHTATLLPDGRVLVAGGSNGYYSAPTLSEVYNPETNTWQVSGALDNARYLHTATLLPDGRVLVVGGRGDYYYSDPSMSAEVYDVATGTWSPTSSLPYPHAYHTATLLPNGKVLIALGEQGYWGSTRSADIYDPVTDSWSTTATPLISRAAFTATLLPSGKVLVAGGSVDYYGGGGNPELYDPAGDTWSTGGALSTARAHQAAIVLPTGKVLVAGGQDSTRVPLAQAEQYDVAAGSWSPTGLLSTGRAGFTVTLLPEGKVLVVGGRGASGLLASAELYDAATGTWSPTGALSTARTGHTATVLPGGKVLVTGGESAFGPEASAELYDAATGTWSSTGALSMARSGHTATVLPGGRVLVSGGKGAAGPVARAEVYEPVSGTWSPTGVLGIARAGHTATVLSGGRVLVIGGADAAGTDVARAELYVPSTGRWIATASLAAARSHHTATVLPDGKVLVAGGKAGSTPLTAIEVYEPATSTFSTKGSLAEARAHHTATVLPDGRVLVAGGLGSTGALASVELYDGTGALEAWRPLVIPPAPVKAGGVFSLSGFGFRGASEASGGSSYSSPTHFPLVQLSDVEGGGRRYLSRRDFSDTSVTLNVPAELDGYYLVTVTTNAISAGTMLFVDGRAPAAPVLTGPGERVNTATPAIEGTAEAGSTVTVTVDGVVVGTVKANASGSWRFTPASALAQGQHTVTATATDAAGNTGAPSQARAFTVDTVAPGAPVLTGPGALITTATPAIEGTAEAGSTVTVTVDGAVVGTVTADASGAWSFTLASELAQGAHVATAMATDAVGNRSPASAARRFTVDSVAPSVPVLTGPGALVNTARPAMGGTAEAGSTVTVTLDGAVAGTVIAQESGAWTFTLPWALVEGEHTVSATATDAAGNTSAASTVRGFIVDTVAPAAPVLTSPGSAVTNATPTIGGTAEPGSTVKVMLDGLIVGATTANASGAWSFTPASPLAQGTHTANAFATDAAGNTGPVSAPRSFRSHR